MKYYMLPGRAQLLRAGRPRGDGRAHRAVRTLYMLLMKYNFKEYFGNLGPTGLNFDYPAVGRKYRRRSRRPFINIYIYFGDDFIYIINDS